MSAPRSDGGGSAIWDLRAVGGQPLKALKAKMAKGESPWC